MSREYSAGTIVGCIRLGVVAAAAAATLLHARGVVYDPAFRPICAVAAIYAITALVVAVRRGGRTTTGPAWIGTDLCLLTLLTYSGGGPSSELDLAYTIPPAIAAVLGRPRHVLWLLAATLPLYSATVAVHALAVNPSTASHALPQILEASARGGLVVILVLALQHRATSAEARARASQRLVGEVMVQEEAVRRQLASELHDTHLQNLYAARFQLQNHDGSDDGLALATGLVEGTLAGLRDRVADLYPATLEHAGLDAAIGDLAARKSASYRTEVTAEVTADLSQRSEQLAYAAVRELLNNAIKHASPSQVTIAVRRTGGDAVVEVVNDGDAIEPGARGNALAAGHIGLASIQDRVEALGGSVRVGPVNGAPGTRAVVRWPAEVVALVEGAR